MDEQPTQRSGERGVHSEDVHLVNQAMLERYLSVCQRLDWRRFSLASRPTRGSRIRPEPPSEPPRSGSIRPDFVELPTFEFETTPAISVRDFLAFHWKGRCQLPRAGRSVALFGFTCDFVFLTLPGAHPRASRILLDRTAWGSDMT